MVMGTRMLQRRGTAAEWASANPVLGDGELGIERDTGLLKIGDGVTAWDALTNKYIRESGKLFAMVVGPDAYLAGQNAGVYVSYETAGIVSITVPVVIGGRYRIDVMGSWTTYSLETWDLIGLWVRLGASAGHFVVSATGEGKVMDYSLPTDPGHTNLHLVMNGSLWYVATSTEEVTFQLNLAGTNVFNEFIADSLALVVTEY